MRCDCNVEVSAQLRIGNPPRYELWSFHSTKGDGMCNLFFFCLMRNYFQIRIR